jgi:putative DNA primase/helicase
MVMSATHPATTVITAESIAKALGGRKVGDSWMARCPAHDDRKPSLSIRDADDGKILLHCHAGCGQERVITALQARGLWKGNGLSQPKCVAPSAAGGSRPHLDGSKRTDAALAIWQAGGLAGGTAVETYLASRGLRLTVPQSIRFHGGLKHPSCGIWPAMLALVTSGSDDAQQAIHRTFLAPDGSGKAPVDPQKMMLGPCRGGAVKLAPAGEVLMVGEGIETCLAAVQATGMPAWAALSTSGLRALDLPDIVQDVIVLADGDDGGEAAARDAALRWKREGRRVRIARPPRGLDFNDIVLGRAPTLGEGV